MKTSLIITTYNWPRALNLCLRSAFAQVTKPDEIIIADDGSKTETKNLIDELRTQTEIPIVHVWHEDCGFRLCHIRNKAIAASTADYIIQVDGDTILDPHFVADHIEVARQNCLSSS